jgi:hypothetical protein
LEAGPVYFAEAALDADERGLLRFDQRRQNAGFVLLGLKISIACLISVSSK